MIEYNLTQSTPDRFARLKALQRPPTPPALSLQGRPLLSTEHYDVGVMAADIPGGSERLAHVLGASTKRNCYGEHLALRCWFGQPAHYAPDVAALQLIFCDASEDIADPQQWLFLDTETTGLAGGTGTYAFLVGIAWWDGGGLETEQLFMREFSDECSLLAALAGRLAERPVLVTFNGKSFDWPLLETRYRMTRAIPPPTPRAHLDFLHPARNLWRLRLGSVRLSELECHVLGWDRGADVISELIPRTYLDFVRGGPPEPLVPVFHHNQMDLRGLAALSSRVLSLLRDPQAHGNDALELYGVSRIYERRGEVKRARQLYEQLIASELPTETCRAARRSLARLAKREGDFELAREQWENTLGSSRGGFESYEHLAIYYEHRARDPQNALAIVHEALAELRRADQLGMISPAYHRQTRLRFEHRLKRLERKVRPMLLDTRKTALSAS
jgi:uncharacterized protein YprB with RNaseH-like and TPR domain